MRVIASLFSLVCGLSLLLLPLQQAVAAGWAPTQSVELIVPAGPGGGGDQMARLIQEIVAKHHLMPHPIVVINKPGDSGAEGFRFIKNNQGNNHQLVVTLSNLFTSARGGETDFSWRDLTPISMMALDQFVLWVSADSPYRSANEYIDAVRNSPNTFRMGGTGSLQEDEIITRAIERAAGVKFKYVPMSGGGDVAEALARKAIDSSVNNPIEALKLWRLGKARPLGVFDSQRMEYREIVAGGSAWSDIPPMKDQGYNIEYLMMRGIFAAPQVPPEVRQYYINVMLRVTQTPEWKEYTKKSALKNKFLTGPAFHSWLTFAETVHRNLIPTK